MRSKNYLAIILLLSMIVPATTIRQASATPSYTWHSTVKVGDWMIYSASISINVYNVINLKYASQITMNITGVNSTAVTIKTTNVTGTLTSIFGSGNNSGFSLPSQILIVPQEFLKNSTWSLGNTTIGFTYLKENDYSKYWRGIEVREANIAQVFSLLGGGSLPFGIQSSSITSYAKWDNVTGFMYDIYYSISGSFPLGSVKLPVLIIFDISMTSASPNIASDISSRADHSMDAWIAFEQFLAGWGSVYILLTVIVAIFVGLYVIKQRTVGRKAAAKPSGTSSSITKARPKQTHIKQGTGKASSTAAKYRKPVKKTETQE
jgi:hypothetical protein